MESMQELSNNWVAFPFETFSDLRHALRTGAASLSPRQDVARNWALSADLGRGGRIFALAFSWCFLWAGAIMVALSWGPVGWLALALLPVAFLSFMINRPWTSPIIALAAIAVTGFGFFGGVPFAAWAGGTWLLVWFLSNGWQNWCTDRFKEHLESDEAFFMHGYQNRWVAVLTKDGKRHPANSVASTQRAVA
jgi:hypothetical protein